jgi:hypothetical protein
VTDETELRQFHKGQAVTVGRDGPTVYVMDCKQGQVTCVDAKSGLILTYNAATLFVP